MRLIEVDSRSYLITFRDNQLSSEYVNIVIRSSLYTYFEFPSISSEELAKIKYIEFDQVFDEDTIGDIVKSIPNAKGLFFNYLNLQYDITDPNKLWKRKLNYVDRSSISEITIIYPDMPD